MWAGLPTCGLALAAALALAMPTAQAGTASATSEVGTLPPYQEDLERLAELMGTLAFMRDICGPSAGPDWRAKMTVLLATEGVTQQRRARLAGRFNQGYEGYKLTYRTCTPAAETIIGRSLAEGARLSSVLSLRLGGE